MSTTALAPAPLQTPGQTPTSRPERTIRPVPLTRLVRVELRKMFDTRAGFWLLASIGIVSVLASTAVILWAPDSSRTQESFSSAIGMPLAVLLPIIAILSVTGEYSQRTGLTTYALVPWRGRVIAAKLVATLLVAVAAMLVALGVGALGTVIGSSVNGLDPVWNIEPSQFFHIVLANVLGMLMGFMLGALFRSSPGAIVGYFVYALVLPGATGALWAFQEWFRDVQPWVDINFAITRLFDQSLTAETAAQLGVTTLVWLWIPLAIGVRLISRSEVK